MFKGDRRITLQRKTEVDDGLSTVTSGWGDLATVWAELKPMSPQERAAAQETAAYNRKTFRIRKDSQWSTLNAADRLLYQDVAHDIEGVREQGRDFYLIEATARDES